MLRCVDLVVSYGGVRALDGLTIAFPDVGLVGIIGPNGAGKTTLFDAITGFVGPASGTCCIGDKSIAGLSPDAVARTGVVRTFQEVRLIGQTSVFENLSLAGADARTERLWRCFLRLGLSRREAFNLTKATELLRSVDLVGKSQRLSCELSYGQQKLLALVCAIATDPRVLLLDEPATGIDIAMQERIKKLMVTAGEDKLVVFAEHDVGIVRTVADLVVVMDQGRIVAQGSPQDVLDRPEILDAYVG